MKTTPYWLDAAVEALPPLSGNLTADAVVIGGGVAGLTVAQLLSERGFDVVLLEQETCGSGATGRSSGFMTPDSELQVDQLARRFGDRDAGLLWRAAATACDQVRETLLRHQIACDYLAADSFYAGIGGGGRSTAEKEHQTRIRLGLSSAWYSAAALPGVLNGRRFEGGLRYGGTFSITPFKYVIGLRDWLRASGVRVYERSAVSSVEESLVTTGGGSVRCNKVFFCADRFLDGIGHVRQAAYHAQTFLAASEVLPSHRFKTLFPDGDLLVWDTQLIYQYFRRTTDSRLLLGGGLLRKTYGPPSEPLVILEHLREYLRQHLPELSEVLITNLWSGLIGVTRDLLPLAGADSMRPTHFYAGCGAGIPWSLLAARCAVEAAVEGGSSLQRFFDPRRAFTDLDIVQPVLRKPATFALSHSYAKGLLKGSANDVKRRLPYVMAGLIVALIVLSLPASRKCLRWVRRRQK